MPHVGVIFDDGPRPETTGQYALRALQCLTDVVHLRPADLPQVDPNQFRLFLRVDDGLEYDIPPELRPLAWWAIDTHLSFERCLKQAQQADIVFAAQKNGAEQLHQAGISNVHWLLLACDPVIHGRRQVENRFDVAFVGNVFPGARTELLNLLREKVPRCFLGQCDYRQMAEIYSASKIVFNRSLRDDLNMRVFEGLCSGSLLLTNSLLENGQEELFQAGVHAEAYQDADELLDKIQYYLTHEESRQRIAMAGWELAHRRHTYLHRMQQVLRTAERQRASAQVRVSQKLVPPDRKISACLLSWKRPQQLRQIVEQLLNEPRIDDIVIWNNNPEIPLTFENERVTVVSSDRNRVTYGRYLATRYARHDVIYTQDDDCLVQNLPELIETFRADPTRMAHALKLGHLLQNPTHVREGAHMGLLGWGAVFHRDWVNVLEAYRECYGEDPFLVRDADRLFSILQQRRHRTLLADVIDLEGHDGPEAMSVQLEHQPLTQQAIEQAYRFLRENRGNGNSSRDKEASSSVPSPQPVTHHGPLKSRIYYEFDRPEVLELVPRSAEHILDIGCGGGKLGAAIKRRQPAHVTGIELNSNAAEAACQRLDDVYIGNVQSEGIDFPEGTFDCVICADVLEHLRDPAAVLKKIRRWLTPEGMLVTSLPNVRNHMVIRSLLAGNWTYESAGLLDEDHVRFFTRREIEKLLFRCGFDVQELRAIGGPGFTEWQQQGCPQQVTIGPLSLQVSSPAEAAEFFAYQFLTTATPQPIPNLPFTSIILVTFNQWSQTKVCLDSIRLVTDEPYEIIIVDNGSTDGTVDYLRSASDVRLIANGENLGFPAAANQGILVAQGEQVLLLNNDTLVTTGWLSRLTAALHSASDVGLVGPVTNHISGEQQVPVPYDDLAQLDGFAWDWGKQHHRQYYSTDRLVGFCLLIKQELINRIGLLDERFGIGNFEDDDYCRRAREAGYHCLIAQDTFIHHAGSATFRGSGTDLNALLQTNHKLYQEKWNERGQGPEVRDQRNEDVSVRPADGAIASFPVEKTLGAVLAVRDRSLQTVEKTLQSYLHQTVSACDQVLVDDGSTVELGEAYHRLCQQYGWRYLRVESRQKPWSSARAYNAAIQALNPEIDVVFKNDIDVVLTGTVLERALQYGSDRLCLFQKLAALRVSGVLQEVDDASIRAAAAQGDPMSGEGVVAFPRNWFTAIGGYDLFYEGWGFEDSDLRLRAERSLGLHQDHTALLLHQWHPRTEQQTFLSRNQAYYQSTKERFTLVRNSGILVPDDALSGNNSPDVSQREPPVLPAPKSRVGWHRFLLDSNAEGELLLKPNPIRLSACLIVRDNENTIRPCLESLRPWVDELIVVDTGSRDRTPEICEALGATVHHWPWRDSFSLARNESFRHARGEWIFWMDSDDTLPEHCGQKLRELADRDHPENLLGYLMQVHCPGITPQDITSVDHVKLIRNRPDLEWEFHIHEQILPSIRRAEGDVAWTDIYVVHSGSDHSESGHLRKLERDFRLLHRDLTERPDHPFVLFNFGMTHADAGQHDQAIQYLKRCIQVSGKEESHLRKAYALLIGSLMQISKPEEAFACCTQSLRLFPNDKELLFRQAMLFHSSGRLEEAEQTYLRILQEQTPRHFASVDLGITDYKARHNLAIVYEDLGQPDIAEQVWNDILLTHPHYEPALRRLPRTAVLKAEEV